MYTERMQILLSPEHRRRLEAEARRTGASIASLVREALDERFGRVEPEDRLEAVRRIRSRRSELLPVDQLEELIDSRFDGELARSVRGR
ncbi:MAG: hypothetical protein ACR2IN_08470 [Thermoleophilaceae bacterium]|jgi:hypothetical protein